MNTIQYVTELSSQTDEVLSKDSGEELQAGGHPGPLTEVNFWQEKYDNLVSLYEQMEGEVTQKMASILNSTDSAYFPSFKKMFDKVVSALIEAMDITLYLKPLSEHFEVLPQNQSYSHCNFNCLKDNIITNESL